MDSGGMKYVGDAAVVMFWLAIIGVIALVCALGCGMLWVWDHVSIALH